MSHDDNTGPSDPLSTLRAYRRPAGGAESVLFNRFEIEAELGKGSFGIVYKAFDRDLERYVAIKMPRPDGHISRNQSEQFAKEAKTLASLDHPGIVPVFDSGCDENGRYYIVSKFISGCDLAAYTQGGTLQIQRAVELLDAIAEALHFAHAQGHVHRDIKPSNILVDNQGNPFLVDFGLAIPEAAGEAATNFAGTPMYMSPEQARGESHRVDRRSDIFSLGIVMYEMLTGSRPFNGSTDEVLRQIILARPESLRRRRESVPKELELICLRALARRASDRFPTAREFSKELRAYRDRDAVPETTVHSAQPLPQTVMPKGLLAFDSQDSQFFLDLIPGPRDRRGMPQVINFWKSKLEQPEEGETFSVGLVYGPSGCGKSSLVRAGLLPNLSEHVVALYLEATGKDTETELLHKLRRKVEIPSDCNLVEAVRWIRCSQRDSANHKIIIIIDQFEQWLNGRTSYAGEELVDAIRQADGGRVQFLIMVRDDFWMAVTRFQDELDARFVQGENMSSVELFDLEHAKKVLTLFGQAYGRLPATGVENQPKFQLFLDKAVSKLSQNGQVICVRLALFAEMLKRRPWEPATLQKIGGRRGLGVAFFEECFRASTAPPDHKKHQRAARKVLELLLPAKGAVIRGHLRSEHELREASGYAEHPSEFETLMHILENETRLIRSVDPGSVESQDEPGSDARHCYQLTHDHLVPLLRTWIKRCKEGTRAGRASLRLEERTRLWADKRDPRFLPSPVEFLNIWLLTNSKDWSSLQQQMMSQATRYFSRLSVAVGACLLVVAGLVFVMAKEVHVEHQANEMLKQVTLLGEDEIGHFIDDWPPSSFPGWYLGLFFPAVEQRLTHKLHEQFRSPVSLPAQTNATVMLASLGFTEPLRSSLKLAHNSLQRNYLIARYARSGGPIDPLLQAWSEFSIRAPTFQALVLTLGNYSTAEVAEQRLAGKLLIDELTDEYFENNDAGVHSAIQWVLTKWNASPHLPQPDGQDRLDVGGWYVAPNGHTMVVLAGQDGKSKFAISSTEVTIGQLRQSGQWSILHEMFGDDSQEVDAEKQAATASSEDDEMRPANVVDLSLARAYCNWLSTKEGMAPFYHQNGNQFAYRLPTEQEWNVASGCISLVEAGLDVTLLQRYAWHNSNSSGMLHPVGQLGPNARGIFDMHGNVMEWCQENDRESHPWAQIPQRLVSAIGQFQPFRYDWRESFLRATGKALSDAANKFVEAEQTSANLAGGSFNDFPDRLFFQQNRKGLEQLFQLDQVGFRVVRSIPESPSR